MRSQYDENYEKAYRRRKRERRRLLKRKVYCFCCFYFILGMLCGKVVFGKEKDTVTDAENTGMLMDENAGSGQMDGTGTAKEDDSWMLALVNPSLPVDADYQPEVEEIENNLYFDARAVSHLRKMLVDGRKEGLDFWVCSAYRTMEKQRDLFDNKVRRVMAEEGLSYDSAVKKAGTEVAYPGTSEHELGLAVDIVAKDYQILDRKQERTDEAKWLKENCWKYGFILRYPTDKTGVTGIIYEPWHYRYVGKEAAQAIMQQGMCLEEYLAGMEPLVEKNL